jgi:hypothetical protein
MTPAFRDPLRLTVIRTRRCRSIAAVRAALLPPQNEDIAELVRGLGGLGFGDAGYVSGRSVGASR